MRMSEAKSPSREQASPGPRRGLRRFRLWEKKRGNRQTGSSIFGGAGETLLYAGLFLVGVATLTQLIWLRVSGTAESFVTSNWGMALSVLLLGSLIVIGIFGSIYSVIVTGTSAERRAAIANRAKDSELMHEVQPTVPYPTIPDDANWKNSPGIRLAYRLPSATSPSWRLVVVASFCLLWNGSVAVLAVLAFHQGDSFTFTSLFDPQAWTLFRLIVFAYSVIGVVAINYLLSLLFAAASIGPTSVEVSSLPLYPGGTYDVFLSQAGHLKLDWLELRLICEEEVSFSDGTDTRVEVCQVYDGQVFREANFEIVPSEPFQHLAKLTVPIDAMHSFVSGHNSVIWKLVVTLQPHSETLKRKSVLPEMLRRIRLVAKRSGWLRRATDSWPPVQRVYPLVLHPLRS